MKDEAQSSLLSAPMPYLDLADDALGRLFSLQDAEPGRPSYGSFDRTWWGWKFTDFSASRFQEGVFPVAFALTSELMPSAVRESDRLLGLCEAGLEFWTSLQHADGSFDEAYPYERSFAATAFTTFYIGMAVERIRSRLSSATLKSTLHTIERAADWIARSGEQHATLANHIAAGATALCVAGDLCGSDRWKQGMRRHLDFVYSVQDPAEGWFSEYGGADPGYQSRGLTYLTEIWSRTGDSELLERLGRAIAFDAWFANPDGTLGGEYASRGTKFAFPYPFERLAGEIPMAGAIAENIRGGLVAGRGLGLREMDVWNFMPLLTNYLMAAETADPGLQAVDLPWRQEGATAVFENAGCVVSNRGGRLLQVGMHSGGGLKLWDVGPEVGELVYEDSGYLVRRDGGRLSSSQGTSTGTASEHEESVVKIETISEFADVSAMTMTPLRFIAFRVFTLTVGRLPKLAKILKNYLVRVLILKRGRSVGTLRRQITFDAAGKLQIDDEITGLAGAPEAVARFIPYHMGSARYANMLDAAGASIGTPDAESDDDGSFRRRALI
jgi:hypothetical protein